jgi:hypothetical protein
MAELGVEMMSPQAQTIIIVILEIMQWVCLFNLFQLF